MGEIVLQDLEVWYRIGVPENERAQPQRLLITLALETDLSQAAKSDCLDETIDYGALAAEVSEFGAGKSWKLLERLAAELADFVLSNHRPRAVRVTVKKFIVPHAQHVAVTLRRERRQRSRKEPPKRVNAN